MFSSARPRGAQISITGTLGSGKSTVGRTLSAQLKWKYFSTGAAQREIAQSLGISTLELNRLAETDRAIDEKVDAVFQKLGKQNGVVVDSRMAWHFMPTSFRVRLLVTPAIAASRILKDTDRDAEKYASESIAIADIRSRAESERRRFLNTYAVDVTDFRNYDFIIDTSGVDQASATQFVLCSYFNWRTKLAYHKHIISPKILLPTQSIRSLDEHKVIDYRLEYEDTGFGFSDIPNVLVYDGNYLIVDGHHRVCAAIQSGLMAIPIKLLQEAEFEKTKGISAEVFARDSVQLSLLYDWEDACGFKFATVPPWVS